MGIIDWLKKAIREEDELYYAKENPEVMEKVLQERTRREEREKQYEFMKNKTIQNMQQKINELQIENDRLKAKLKEEE